MESISKNKFYEIGYAELIEKSDSFQEILATKKLLFWKSSCSEEVPASKKYIFWILIYSGKKLLWNSACAEKSIYLQEVAD